MTVLTMSLDTLAQACFTVHHAGLREVADHTSSSGAFQDDAYLPRS